MKNHNVWFNAKPCWVQKDKRKNVLNKLVSGNLVSHMQEVFYFTKEWVVKMDFDT
jgi:hypothetical protein